VNLLLNILALHRNYCFINVQPIVGALGAEIKGVNIARHIFSLSKTLYGEHVNG
jgi:hypothetical protein